MVEDSERPDKAKVADAPAPQGGMTIFIRFPPGNMKMQAQISGQINDDQLAKAAMYLIALSTMRVQAAIQQQLAAENEAIMARKRLLDANGHFLAERR